MKSKIGRRFNILLIFFLIIVILVGTSFYQSKHSLTCTSYSILIDEIKKSIRIVQITDLHNSMFGEKNHDLVDLVSAQSPDLILITGDLLNSDDDRVDIACDLISGLCTIAPVYVSLGNHEVEYQEKFGVDIAGMYEEAGAAVLEKEYVDISINGQQLRLGGIYGYCLPAEYLSTGEAAPEECRFLTEFQNTERYTILLCHMPACWIVNDGISEWDVDCVFAGHAHGGQIRIPFIGGLWAPDQGWFPGKECGLYFSDDESKVMVLSRGLGSTETVPRLNNIPEVVIVDFMPKQSSR